MATLAQGSGDETKTGRRNWYGDSALRAGDPSLPTQSHWQGRPERHKGLLSLLYLSAEESGFNGAAGWGQKVPRPASARICLSSVKSATARRSRSFSFSSYLSRLS